jgi:hypothetical protein
VALLRECRPYVRSRAGPPAPALAKGMTPCQGWIHGPPVTLTMLSGARMSTVCGHPWSRPPTTRALFPIRAQMPRRAPAEPRDGHGESVEPSHFAPRPDTGRHPLRTSRRFKSCHPHRRPRASAGGCSSGAYARSRTLRRALVPPASCRVRPALPRSRCWETGCAATTPEVRFPRRQGSEGGPEVSAATGGLHVRRRVYRVRRRVRRAAPWLLAVVLVCAALFLVAHPGV